MAGANAQGGASAAENETLNNWLNHVTALPWQKSEAQQLADAQAACGPSNQSACDTATSLLNTSAVRDAMLAKACQDPSSSSCLSQKFLAYIAGNNIQTVAGTTIAVEGPQLGSGQPSVGAITLDNMLGSPLAGIMGGAAYLLGGGDRNALYASQFGSSLDALLGSVAGFKLPESPYLSPPNGATRGLADILAENSAGGKAAEVQATVAFDAQGLAVRGQVSLVNGSVRCIADCALNGMPNAVVRIPTGFVAEDLNGNLLVDATGRPITSFNLNAQGQAVVEVKTGNAALTANQSVVYPAVQNGTASGTGSGTNAAKAGMSGNLPPTPVIVLRKKG